MLEDGDYADAGSEDVSVCVLYTLALIQPSRFTWALKHGGLCNTSCVESSALSLEFRAQELCESRGGRHGLPVTDSPYGLREHKATLNKTNTVNVSNRSTTLFGVSVCVCLSVSVSLSPSLPLSLCPLPFSLLATHYWQSR